MKHLMRHIFTFFTQPFFPHFTCPICSTCRSVHTKNVLLFSRDIMCLPSLKQHVYSALSPMAQPEMATVEARLNVMQTVFLALRSFSDPTRAEPSETLLADSQKIFHTLFNRHFDVDMEVCVLYRHTYI